MLDLEKMTSKEKIPKAVAMHPGKEETQRQELCGVQSG